MAQANDDTPVRPPPRSLSAEAEALGDIQLCFIELARDSGTAAAKLDSVEGADRVDVLSLYRRRLEQVKADLEELLSNLPRV